jgi:transposase
LSEAALATETIEHLGLVTGTITELGTTELIDEVIPQDQSQRSVSVGQAVKAMLLNGLGFANRRLYLTPRFFRNKPVERLFGPGITAEMLNNDTLDRALDSLHDFGVTELFALISQQAAVRLDLQPKTAHLDTASFHVDGRYQHNGDGDGTGGVAGDACADDSDAGTLTHGYSRDHRPDLKQVVLELIESGGHSHVDETSLG